ncbi:MAG: ABC transporter permease subunit [Bacillota bacterium]|nr:ABC transporter permease subunit [Bacillota bacterium]
MTKTPDRPLLWQKSKPGLQWLSFPASRLIYAVLSVVLFWIILHVVVGKTVIPSPWQTVVNLVVLLPRIGRHLAVSLYRILASLLISTLSGGIIGLWIGLNKKADQLITPVVYLLYPLPKIAFLPILLILFGLGDSPKIILIVIIVIFQIIIAARDGVREIPPPLFHSVLSLGLGRRALYRHLILPAVTPRILTAVRISIGVSISVLFFAESFATTYGIGYFIMNSWLMVNYVNMFSGILALGLLGLLLFSVVDLIEQRICRWMKAGSLNTPL